MTDSTLSVALRDISPNPWNPHRMKPEELDRLKASVQDDGQLRPILVIEMDVPDTDTPTIKTQYRIIDGEHLYRACQAIGLTEVQVLVYGKNSEVPLWKQKEFGQVLNHGMRGSVEDPAKTRAIYQELIKHRAPEQIALRVGLGEAGIRSLVEPTEVTRTPGAGALGVRSTAYEERKAYTVALVFDEVTDMRAFEHLIDEIGPELVDADDYSGRRGQYRIAVLQRALQLAGESIGAL